MRRTLAMLPTMLSVGFSSALAYRAEFIVWILTTNLPLVNLVLWTAVARDGPVRGFGAGTFAAYFLATLAVRQLTGCWVVWEMSMEVRQGTLGMRLLRPVHPLMSYATDNLAAQPLRLAMSLPVWAVLLFGVGFDHLSRDPLAWAAVPVMTALAWTMTFLVMCAVGCLAFFVESATSVYELWTGLYLVFSGYLVPLELFPPWLAGAARVLPFRLMLGLPVEAIVGRLDRPALVEGLLLQLAWVAGLAGVVHLAWRAGLRRFGAFGG